MKTGKTKRQTKKARLEKRTKRGIILLNEVAGWIEPKGSCSLIGDVKNAIKRKRFQKRQVKELAEKGV